MPGSRTQTFMNQVRELALQYAPLSGPQKRHFASNSSFLTVSTNQTEATQGKRVGFCSACN